MAGGSPRFVDCVLRDVLLAAFLGFRFFDHELDRWILVPGSESYPGPTSNEDEKLSVGVRFGVCLVVCVLVVGWWGEFVSVLVDYGALDHGI